MKRKKFAATLAILALVLFAGIFNASNINASAASNSLSATYKYLYVGQSYSPTVKGSYSNIKWSTSNSNIASVTSSGKVTAKNIGRANIYATVDGNKLTLKVEIVSKTTYNAVKYANNAVGCSYSQSKRMSKGYYDCGSLVWRAYANAGLYIGGKTDWAPTAASGADTLNDTYKTISYSSVSASNLLPGDLIYTSTSSNGRYRNITHAAMYVGNGKIVEAANSRVGVVKRNYSTKNIVLIARPTVKVSNKLQETLMTTTKSTSSSVTNTSIKIDWKKVRGASGYYVYRKVEDGKWKKIATVKDSDTLTYTDKTAYAGKYIYTVKAYSGSKAGPYNSNGMTASTKLAAPSKVSADDNTKGIKIKWNTVKYATGYKIYRKTTNGSYSLLKTVSDQDTSAFQDSKAESGTKYIYTIKAYRKNSSSSTTVSKKSDATKTVCFTEPVTVASENAETAAAMESVDETTMETTAPETTAEVTETSTEESSAEESSITESSADIESPASETSVPETTAPEVPETTASDETSESLSGESEKNRAGHSEESSASEEPEL